MHRRGSRRRPHVALPQYPGLDGLRALAVVAVLLYHGGVSWSGGGFLGVEMFFVLSGFLITSLLVAEWGALGADRAARVLGPARPATAPRAVRAGGGDRRLLRAGRPHQGDPRPAGRRDRHAAVRLQLAPGRRGHQLLRRQRSRVAAAAHLVAGHRGAVLRPVAAGRARVLGSPAAAGHRSAARSRCCWA